MNPTVQAALVGALAGGVITAIGWFVTALLSRRGAEESRRQEAALQHLQHQIEDFYGPLFGLIQQAQTIREVASLTLPSDSDGRIDFSRFADRDGEIWQYFVEIYFLPLNAQMMQLIRTKLYLLEGGTMPESFKAFFHHQAHFEGRHRLWKDKHADTSSKSGPGWPPEFDSDVEASLSRLRSQYQRYLQQLAGL